MEKGKKNKLVDPANRMDVHKNPTPSIVNGKQNRNNFKKNLKPWDANERQGMHKRRNPNGLHQSKAQKKPQFKFYWDLTYFYIFFFISYNFDVLL